MTSAFGTFAEILPVATEADGTTTRHIGAQSIVLTEVARASLHEEDFEFV